MLRLFRLGALGCVVLPAVALAQSPPARPTTLPVSMQFSAVPADPAAALQPNTVYMAAGQLRSIRPATADELKTEALNATLDVHHVIQLTGPITREQRIALEHAGVVVRDYLPTNAYIADLAATDADAFSRLSFVRAAVPIAPEWKLSPELNRANFTTFDRKSMAAAGRSAVLITVFGGEDPAPIADMITATFPNSQVFYASRIGDGGEISVALNTADVAKLAQIPAVQFIEPAPELTLRNSTTTWIAQSNVLNFTPVYNAGIHGEGQIVGHMDGKIDQNHCAFAGGKSLFYNTTAGVDSHGTHTACTAAGYNAGNADLRGIAYNAKIVFDDIPSFTDAAMYANLLQHHNQGARVHTNSWGDDGTTSYNSLCRGIDRFSYDYEDSLVMFAVTNTSALKNPENAKNLLAVGASNDTPNQANFCSGGQGPTVDGRRKPEVYLPGCNTTSARSSTACSTIGMSGTSMASPAVTGAAALVRQYFVDGFYPTGVAVPSDGFTPSGALIKAVLVNSATDMTGITGYPSNREGWGRILLDDTLYFPGNAGTMIVDEERNATGLTTGNIVEIPFTVTSTSPRLRATLVWVDPPASASTGSAAAWINNLDLEIVDPGNVVYKGNVLSGGVSISGGTADDRNNVEQVILATPTTGSYIARIKATAVNTVPVGGGGQGYAIVLSGAVNEVPPTPLTVSLIDPVPSYVPLSTPVVLNVDIDPGTDALVANSAKVFVADDGSTFTPFPLTFVSGTTWSATIPGFDVCENTPAFYFSAQGASTGVVTDPPTGASNPYTFILGSQSIELSDDMESDLGWTVDALSLDTATAGVWNRVDPVQVGSAPDISQPGDDATTSGALCWATDGSTGSPASAGDVDGGSTSLYSPVIDLTGKIEAEVSYARWYSNHVSTGGETPNADTFLVEVSSDGVNWVTAQNIGPSGPLTQGGWVASSFHIEDYVSLSSTVQIRFTASDTGADSVVEAAIDDVVIAARTCNNPPPPCAGDITGDGQTNVSDFNILASNFGAGPGATLAQGDLTGDGFVNVSDFNILAGNFGCGVP